MNYQKFETILKNEYANEIDYIVCLDAILPLKFYSVEEIFNYINENCNKEDIRVYIDGHNRFNDLVINLYC